MKKFVFIIHHLDPGKASKYFEEHAHWINNLRDAGHFVSGGPFVDESGGIAIIQAESADEANKLLLSQPLLKAGVSTIEMKEWDQRI